MCSNHSKARQRREDSKSPILHIETFIYFESCVIGYTDRKDLRMEKLFMFNRFDWDAFAEKKTLMHVRTDDWTDFDTGKHLGVIVQALITTDDTEYGNQGTGFNLYEKIKIKVPHDITIPKDAEIVPVKVVANLYGEYRNQLRITAEDIKVTSK